MSSTTSSPHSRSNLLADTELVPRRLTGKLWFIFTQALAEADHTRTPDEILHYAWNYQDKLQDLFGPPLVATAEAEDRVHILLEGHTRASAYVRALNPSDPREVIVGYVPSLSGWHWY